MAISRELVDKIINAADIVSIIGEYVTLEKKGSDYKGLCPFHNDSNPSLSVSPEKRVFKCFSCNTSGNVVQFIQKIENISFSEALKKIADKCGIVYNVKTNPQEEYYKKTSNILSEAATIYEFYLKNTIEGKKALEYLNKRNINEDVIKRFRIGLSSHESNILCTGLIEGKKILPLDLQELGLIGTDKDRYYDRFRGRIMFPLEDLRGNIIGFSGRVYDTESDSKYINSPESKIFKKSNVLYNYFRAINEIKLKNQVIIFEGFMDVIAAYKANVINVVATMGTALTEQQIKILLELTKNVVLCYDGDNPGIEATKRAIKMFAKFNINVSVCLLPDKLDPDDYGNKFGNEALADLLYNKNVNSIDYLYEIEKRSLNTLDPVSVVNFQKAIYRIINFYKSKALEQYILKKMSDDLHIEVHELDKEKYNTNELDDYDALNSSIPDNEVPYDEVPYEELQNEQFEYDPIDGNKNNVYHKRRTKARYVKAEQGIVYLAFYQKSNCIRIKKRLGIDDFVDKINRNILYKLYDYYGLHEIMNIDEFVMLLDPLELDTLNAIINSNDIYTIECIDDYIDIVKLAKYEKTTNDIINDGEKSQLNKAHELGNIRKKTLKIKKT